MALLTGSVQVGGSTVTHATIHTELNHVVVRLASIAAGVAAITGAVENDRCMAFVTVHALGCDIVVLSLSTTFSPVVGIVTGGTASCFSCTSMTGRAAQSWIGYRHVVVPGLIGDASGVALLTGGHRVDVDFNR